MQGLTKRQRELVDYIQHFISVNRYSPSYREICTHFGFSSLGSVYKHITILKKKGALLGESKTSRSITLKEELSDTSSAKEVDVPLIGYITAGMPIQTFPQSQRIQIPSNYVHSPDKTYALRVKGDSLMEEMIADGDILLIEARSQAHPGETVIALINGHDIIVKKYYPEGELVRFLGSYSSHNPILLKNEDAAIQAVVVSLLRLYG